MLRASVAVLPDAFVAETVTVTGWATGVAVAGVPEIVAVPFPLSVKVRPDGGVPARVIAGAG
jgi:hypothetical protein